MSWPTSGVNRLIDAMVHAEGGEDAFLRAVRISIPTCQNYHEARAIAANTISHAMWDKYIETADGSLRDFVLFLGNRWAPIGAINDPDFLNKNWVPNIIAYLKLGPESGRA